MPQSPICPAPARRQPKTQSRRLDRVPHEQSNAGMINSNSLQQSRAKARCQTRTPGLPRKARRRWWQGRRPAQGRAVQAGLWRTVRGGGCVSFGVFAGGGPWKNKGHVLGENGERFKSWKIARCNLKPTNVAVHEPLNASLRHCLGLHHIGSSLWRFRRGW